MMSYNTFCGLRLAKTVITFLIYPNKGNFNESFGLTKLLTAFKLIICIISICSCADKSLDKSCVNIPLHSTDTIESAFVDYFDITMCLPLEETEESHITSVRRLEYFDGKYYVSCSSGNVGLFVFDKEGKFIRKIGNKGNGRGEYSNILDFSVDRKNRRILLLGGKCSLVKVYSLDGEYIEDKILHKTALSDIACVNGTILCPTNHQGFTRDEKDSLFYVFDDKLNFVKKHTFISDNNIGMTSVIPSNIKAYGDKFVYSDFHEHRTFLLNKNGEIERCFRYDEDNLMPLEKQKNINTFIANQRQSSFILSSAILDNKCVTFYKTEKGVRISINTVDGESVINSPINTFPYFLGYEEGQAISVVSNDELKKLNLVDRKTETDESCFYILKYKLKN